jgi:hypothetical protein
MTASQWWIGRFVSSGMCRCVVWQIRTVVSEGPVTSIFRVEGCSAVFRSLASLATSLHIPGDDNANTSIILDVTRARAHTHARASALATEKQLVSKGKISDSCSKGDRFEFWSVYQLLWQGFKWFYSVSPDRCRSAASNRVMTFHCTYFLVYHWVTFLTFDAILAEFLRVLLNKS